MLPLVNAGGCQKPINMSGELLISNYPNPFSGSTVISFKTDGGHTLVQIMDASGKVIANLTDKEYTAGTYSVVFESGLLPAGVYYARLQNMATQQVRAMIKVK